MAHCEGGVGREQPLRLGLKVFDLYLENNRNSLKVF